MIGIIGGTGLGEALFGEPGGQQHRIDTPFGKPSAPIRVVRWHGLDVALLQRHGDGHLLNPSQVPYRANIYALKALGVTHVIASGAVGSLREHLAPRHLVLVDQTIDKTYRRTPTFFDAGLVVHVDVSQPFCPQLRGVLQSVASQVGTTVHPQGTYVCVEGPAFSTAAESRMHQAWGADVVGMTALPEARLAREAELPYALVALVTDFDCWKPHAPGSNQKALLVEILSNLKDATANAMALIRAAVEALAANPLGPSPTQTALDLAIWTDRRRIPPELVQHYSVLLERYSRAQPQPA